MGISKHHSGPMLLLSARSVKPVIKVYKIKLRLLYRHSLLFVRKRIPVQGQLEGIYVYLCMIQSGVSLSG